MKAKTLILSLLILTSSCKYFESEVEKPVEKKVVAEVELPVSLSIKAVALFSVGKSTVNGKKIHRGDILDLSEKILVEPKSFLDIEFVEHGVASVLRIKGKAVLQMKAEKEGGLFDLGKVKPCNLQKFYYALRIRLDFFIRFFLHKKSLVFEKVQYHFRFLLLPHFLE